MKIGFIGTGVMGRGIINNLLKADYEVVVYNRHMAGAESVIKNGAIWAATPGEVAEQTDVTFTMVGYPKDVEDVYYGTSGILAHASEGQILVDMTTSTPTLAEQLFAEGQQHGVHVVDAPVSGGDIGATNGTLSVMVGAEMTIYTKIFPILNVLGEKINLFGGAGKGQHAKMANQIMIASTMLGMAESLTYAKTAGLDLRDVIETLSGGGAQNWSLANLAPRILNRDFEPGFYAKHLLKDLRIALDEAKKMELELPATELAEQMYAKLSEEMELGNEGTQAIVKLWAQFN